MNNFLEKFKDRVSRIGKQGLFQLLNSELQPQDFKHQKNHQYGHDFNNYSKSIGMCSQFSRAQRITLPPIKLDSKSLSKNTLTQTNIKKSRSSVKSRTNVETNIKQKEQQLYLSRKKIISTANRYPFANIPNQFPQNKISSDQMRFLKSFEKYKNNQHFTIHRKMSQGN